MQSQISCGVPFGICVSYKDYAEPPFFWGDSLPVPPLLGRQFRHGPSGNDGRGDCYALVRDYYRLERGVTLPDFPRDNDWWRSGEDLYSANFEEAGFLVMTPEEQPEAGDVALITVPRSNVVNHAAVYLGGGLILHHLYNRLSVREPVGRWQRHIVRWIRHET
jgi:cell wall-associated NlpC family hydrolase